MRRKRTLSACASTFAAAALACAAGLPAGAQTINAEIKVVGVDTADYPTIRAVVTAPMVLSGQRLATDEFTVLEGDERRPVEVRPFDPAALELVVVIDSIIKGDPFINAQGGLLEVPVHLSGPTMSIVSAGTVPTVALPPTQDRDAVSTVFRGLVPGRGPAAMEDAMGVALDQFNPAGSRRAVMVVTSDVALNPSRVAALTARAQRGGVAMYIIGLGSSLSPDIIELASSTGGAAWVVEPGGIVPAIDQVVAELQSQYELIVTLEAENPTLPITLLMSSGDIRAHGRLPVPAPPLTGPAAEPMPVGDDDGSPLGTVFFVAVVVGVVLLLAGLLEVKFEVFPRSRGRLRAG
jgi:hypothetical protein